VTTPVDNDSDGEPDWYVAVIDPVTDLPIVKYDPGIQSIGPTGVPTSNPTCNATTNAGCTCSSNRACGTLEQYVSVPFFLRQAMSAYGLVDPDMKGVY
jgi:hypothetical protein